MEIMFDDVIPDELIFRGQLENIRKRCIPKKEKIAK